MQNFKDYSYTIQIDKLEETARAAASTGCKIYMIINGEFYDIDMDGGKLEDWKRYRKGR